MSPAATRSALLIAVFAASSFTPAAAQAPAAGTLAGQVGSRSITLEEVDRLAMVQDAARFRGLRLRDAIFEARRLALEGVIAEELIARAAARAGIAPADLVLQEIGRTMVAVTDQDVEEWYRSNQARIGGAGLDQIAGKIREALEQQRRDEAKTVFVARLRAAADVEVLLAPHRESIAVAADEPAAGPEDAPVQIVMYSDFQCPFCARVEPTLKKIRQLYGDRVRLVFRDFPLSSIHPRAAAAAAAAHCAAEQGRFWEYHDRLFASQSRLEDADLIQYAAALGLDPARFGGCVKDARSAAIVSADARSGEQLGVSATPAFFVNGRFLPGAQPLEAFQRVIDDELKLAGRPAATSAAAPQPGAR